jgi:PAS domain S-box-containing protein
MSMEEDIYRELVDCQQDLIVKFNPEGRLLFVNPAYCAIMGKTQNELTGSVFMPVTGERDTDAMATHLTKLFRPPFACIVEQWIPSSKGLRCISWSAKSILDKNNRVTAIVATGRDITRIKREERITRQRDDDLMLLIESGQQMYYTHTPDHVLQYSSPRIRTLLGRRSPGGKRLWTDYLSDNPLNAAGVERTVRAVTSGRREPPYRLELLRVDGTRIWVEVNEIPVVKNGKTVAIAGSVVDITEKMQIDEGFAEAEILFKGSGRSFGKRDEPVASELKSHHSVLR